MRVIRRSHVHGGGGRDPVYVVAVAVGVSGCHDIERLKVDPLGVLTLPLVRVLVAAQSL